MDFCVVKMDLYVWILDWISLLMFYGFMCVDF